MAYLEYFGSPKNHADLGTRDIGIQTSHNFIYIIVGKGNKVGRPDIRDSVGGFVDRHVDIRHDGE